MKQIFFAGLLLFITQQIQCQTYQQSISGAHTISIFNSVKYDAKDNSIINAGYMYDSTKATGRDWYLVKLDKNKNIVWQKIIKNAGEDFIYKIIICRNGDYVAVGLLTQYGIPRGFICRLNSLNGDIIWSSITNNSLAGEICYDAVETKNGNIAVAATDKWTGSPDCFIIVLNASGKKIWSKISTYGSPDQPYSIGQLPNSNLLVGVNEWVGGHYNLILIELKASDGSIVKQNTYSINATIPNSGLTVNSLSSWGINIIDEQVSLYCFAFQDCCSTSSMCIFKYNTNTRNLTGNIYYHTNDINTIAFNYIPLGKDDFLISESFINPSEVYVSRITNNYVVYDDLIKSPVTSIRSIDTATNSNAIFSGSILYKKHDNAYNLFVPQINPVTNASCNIVSSNTLNLIASNLYATPTTDINFISSGLLINSSIQFTTPVYKLANICGNVTTINLSDVNPNTLKEQLFTVAPNPATATIHFTIPVCNKESTLSIYNINGKKEFTQQLNANITSKDIDISKFAPGIYNALLVSNGNTLSLKIIKQ